MYLIDVIALSDNSLAAQLSDTDSNDEDFDDDEDFNADDDVKDVGDDEDFDDIEDDVEDADNVEDVDDADSAVGHGSQVSDDTVPVAAESLKCTSAREKLISPLYNGSTHTLGEAIRMLMSHSSKSRFTQVGISGIFDILKDLLPADSGVPNYYGARQLMSNAQEMRLQVREYPACVNDCTVVEQHWPDIKLAATTNGKLSTPKLLQLLPPCKVCRTPLLDNKHRLKKVRVETAPFHARAFSTPVRR